MKKGMNTLAVLVTDISGNEITGLDQSDFEMVGRINADTYATGDIEEVIDVGDGYYHVDVDIVNKGQGHISIKATDEAYFTTPDFFMINSNDRDIDDVYNRLAINFIDIGTLQPDGTFITTSLSMKEGDCALVSVVAPMNITGFTDYEADVVYSTTTAPSGDNLVGSMEFVSVDEESRLVIMRIPELLTKGIVDEGESNIILWSDIQAMDGNCPITIAELRINVRREFTL